MANPRPHRGATLNTQSGRFGVPQADADGDWLDARDDVDGAAPPLRTTVTVEHPRTIIARNTSPDVPFDRSINPYRGCEHGCIYCFARPSHAYHDLSPGLDFETKLFAKPDAATLLRTELSKKGYVCEPIAMGTNTDPYQPIETHWRVTREVIEVLVGLAREGTTMVIATHDLRLAAGIAHEVVFLDAGEVRSSRWWR